jgi:hypothetical protein
MVTITFLSLYKSIPYEAYKRILFVHKDTYLFLQVLPYSLLAIWSSPFFFILLSLILLMPHTPTMA